MAQRKRKTVRGGTALEVYSAQAAAVYDEQDMLRRKVCAAYLNYTETESKLRGAALAIRAAKLQTPNLAATCTVLENILIGVGACRKQLGSVISTMGVGISADRTQIRKFLGGRL